VSHDGAGPAGLELFWSSPFQIGLQQAPGEPLRQPVGGLRITQGWNATFTGTEELVAVPSPNCPYSLSPQQ